MAMDSMKFGPEWLRNMKSGDSSGGVGNNAPPPLSAPIKMAEFRYGREEMLALFDRTILPPDPLRQREGLYVKEIQLPLTLFQMTEEETRMWNRGINSDAALRLNGGAGRGGQGAGPGGQRGAMGGRGGSVDRGRGRAPRGSYHYRGGLSYDDQENTNGYARGMRNSYDRSQSGGGWGERNGGDTGESPRKEFARSMSDTNWRRHRMSGGEEDDGWRTSRPSDKWGRGNNWREGEGWDRSRPWEETNNSHPPPRKPWDPEESNLPEWAMENPSESGGSFDASGAFHGGNFSDEEEGGSNHHRGPGRPDQSKSNSSQPRPGPQNKKEPPNITNGTSPSRESGGGDRDNSNVVPLRQSQSATSLATERRPPITTSASFSGVNSHSSLSAVESKPQREQPLRKPPSAPLEQHAAFTSYAPPRPVEEPKPPQRTSHEDEMEQRLLNDADVFVSRLMEDEDGEPVPTPSTTSPSHPHSHPNTQSPIPNPNSDIRWVYQDPQGEIQGNFTALEMTEWYNMGYFKPSLLVRRTGDEIFLPILEMKKFWKAEKPFEVDYQTLPPIKKTQPPLMPGALPQAAPPPPTLDETILLQYQMQLMHQRQQAVYARLSQTEQFNNLSTMEQRKMVAHQAGLPGMEALQGGMMMPHLQQHATTPQTSSNVLAVLQLLAQQQQQQQQQLQQQQRLGAGAGVPLQVGMPAPAAEPTIDPLQQIMAQLGLQGPAPARAPAPATPQNTPEERSFNQFIKPFLQRQTPGPQPAPQPQPPQPAVMESVWGGWSVPPGHPAAAPPQSLWADPISKGIKTEADILEEQLRAEEKKKEELRKQEEILRLKQQEEEERERLRRIAEEEEHRKQQEEMEKERKRLQEAEERKKKEAAAAKKAEENRRKEEEKKRKEEEKKRKEEEKRRLEEEKKRVEEEKKRLEEEKKRQEEMVKRQNEALKRIQEQQQAQARAVKAAATPAPWTPAEPTGPSLADIQKTERKQQQQLREQQEMLRAYQEKHQQQQQQQQIKNSKSASNLNLKWLQTPNAAPTRVKSLAEIQAEEQERMAKQVEKEKAERMAASKEVPITTPGSIWQTANQSLTWTSNSSTSSTWAPMPVNPVSGAGGGGARKPQPQAQAKPQTKTKAKKEEATVLKLFDTQLPKPQEFTQWCTKVLQDANNVDIPTFIDFLWPVESQAEIQDYSVMYLEEPQKAAKFAADFVVRRQKILSNNPQAEVRKEQPSSPLQPSNHFQEVKGRNKKVKKNRMTKVDNRILGFNVTAAPDRINVGDRDYGENI